MGLLAYLMVGGVFGYLDGRIRAQQPKSRIDSAVGNSAYDLSCSVAPVYA